MSSPTASLTENFGGRAAFGINPDHTTSLTDSFGGAALNQNIDLGMQGPGLTPTTP